GQRRPAGIPRLRKGAFELGHCRSADLDAGVAPRIMLLFRIAKPARAHAESAHEADLPIDRNGLAMVAREPAERTVEAGRIEYPDIDTSLAHHRGQPMHAGRTQPIVEHAHAHGL